MGRRIFAAIVAFLFFYVASPLVFPVAMGAVLATLFLPWLEKLERRKFSPRAGSALLTLVITLFFVLPSSLLVFVGTREALSQLQELRLKQATMASTPTEEGGWVHALVTTPRVHSILMKLTEWLPIELSELTQTAQELTRAGAAKLTEIMGTLASHLPGMFVSLAVVVVSVYFFLVDGPRLVLFFRRNSVFSRQQTDHLLDALAGTCRSVILASVVSGAAQGALEFFFCLGAGVPNAALVGIIVFLGSFVPVIGAAPVTVGIGLYQLFVDRTTAGVVLLIGAALVAFLDNIIRPAFLRGSANLHPLLAFVAAFGGLQTLGFSGVFLGPIVAAMFVATVQILVRDDDPRLDRPVL